MGGGHQHHATCATKPAYKYALTAGDIAAFGMVAAKLKSATHSSYRPGAGAPGKITTTEVGYEGMNWRPSSKASPFR